MSLKNFVASVAVVAMAFISVGNTHADIVTFQGGNLASDANWLGSDGITTGRPSTDDTGVIDVNGTLVIGNTLGAWMTGDPELVFGGGAVITAGDGLGIGANGSGDFGHTAVLSSTFNDATLNVDDDIFSNSSAMIFNAGSVTTVGDDFESNGAGTITINGGTHTVGDQFGAQRISTLNFFGGTVTTNGFRTTAQTAAQNPGGTINIGGDATLDANSLSLHPTGIIDFSSAWTGNLDVDGVADLNAWFTALDATTATFDGAALTQAVFDANFQFDGSPGAGLSLVAVPEPSSVALLGLAGLGLMIRRRK